MSTEEKDTLTYEDRIEAMAAMGLHTHEIHVRSWRYKVDSVLKCYSENDAYYVGALLSNAGRVTHDETMISGKYIDDYNGVEDCYEEEDVFRPGGSRYGKGWRVTVWEVYPRDSHNQEQLAGGKPVFMFGNRYGANRMARPDSKVFVWIGGTDCDGYRYGDGHEYPSLRDAADGVDESESWSDGREGHHLMTVEDYEAY